MATDTGDSDSDYEPEYEPEIFHVAGKIELQVLSVVPPPLEFMSALHSQRQEISGRQVWCGSLLCANVLCHLQEQDKDVFRKKRWVKISRFGCWLQVSILSFDFLHSLFQRFSTVAKHGRILELGSGTGLLGMVASKLGDPQCVILTDGDDKAVALLEDNLANPANDMNQTVSKTKALLWGEKQQMEEFSQWCRSTWPETFESDVKFEYIIAGDVMYKAELPPLFFGTCDKFL
jgi:hypothetical protein